LRERPISASSESSSVTRPAKLIPADLSGSVDAAAELTSPSSMMPTPRMQTPTTPVKALTIFMYRIRKARKPITRDTSTKAHTKSSASSSSSVPKLCGLVAAYAHELCIRGVGEQSTYSSKSAVDSAG
jgi:hypothetical protein